MSAISREQSEIVFYRINEIRDETADAVKEKARQLREITSAHWELAKLLTQGFNEFTSKVHQEYDQSSYADLAEVLIPSYKTYFFSDRSLKGEVSQIIKDKC